MTTHCLYCPNVISIPIIMSYEFNNDAATDLVTVSIMHHVRSDFWLHLTVPNTIKGSSLGGQIL